MRRAQLTMAVLLISLAAGTALAQTVFGDMFQLGRRVRSTFPTPSSTVTGALLYDLDAGAVMVTDGTSWLPLLSALNAGSGIAVSTDGGSTSTVAVAGPSTLSSVLVNAEVVAATTYGGEVLPAVAFEVDAVRFRVSVQGSGGTTDAVFRVSDGSNDCDCGFACNTATGNKRVTCTGTCSFAASASLTYSVNSIGDCTTGPTILGTVAIEGNWQ